MSIIMPVSGFDGDEEQVYRRLTADEADALRKLQPSLSPWRIVCLQVIVVLVMAMLAWALTGRTGAAWSAGYGGLAVLVPAVLFARGLMSQFSSINATLAGLGFFVWEAIKLAVSIGMLFAAPQLVPGLDWLAMLAGMIVTLKVYWVALLMRPKSTN